MCRYEALVGCLFDDSIVESVKYLHQVLLKGEQHDQHSL